MISPGLIMYDEPALFGEMVGYIADYLIGLMAPVVKRVQFDFVYIFQDCCGANGPLFSPRAYRAFFHEHYRRILDFYKANGVSYLVNSDGRTDALIPCWLQSRSLAEQTAGKRKSCTTLPCARFWFAGAARW